MKNVNELINETLFDIDVNDNIEDYKVKMKNIINQVNSLIKNIAIVWENQEIGGVNSQLYFILSNNNERRRLLSRIIRLGKGQCVETQMVFGP
jgi:hypothetical protein